MMYSIKLIIAAAAAVALQPCTATVLPVGVTNDTSLPPHCVSDGNESKDDANIKEYEEWIHALMYRRERAVREYNARRYGIPGRYACEGSELLQEINDIDARVKELKDKIDRIKRSKNVKEKQYD